MRERVESVTRIVGQCSNVAYLHLFISSLLIRSMILPQQASRREGIVANILKVTKVPLSESMLSSAVQGIDCHKDNLHLLSTPPIDILRQVTKEMGMPHLRFLALPTTLCYQCNSPLCTTTHQYQSCSTRMKDLFQQGNPVIHQVQSQLPSRHIR